MRRGGRLVAGALAAALLAGCGAPSPDLFVVERSGGIPGARLTMVVDDGGIVTLQPRVLARDHERAADRGARDRAGTERRAGEAGPRARGPHAADRTGLDPALRRAHRGRLGHLQRHVEGAAAGPLPRREAHARPGQGCLRPATLPSGDHLRAMVHDVADFLERHPPFDGLDREELAVVAEATEIEFHAAGEVDPRPGRGAGALRLGRAHRNGRARRPRSRARRARRRARCSATRRCCRACPRRSRCGPARTCSSTACRARRRRAGARGAGGRALRRPLAARALRARSSRSPGARALADPAHRPVETLAAPRAARLHPGHPDPRGGRGA